MFPDWFIRWVGQANVWPVKFKPSAWRIVAIWPPNHEIIHQSNRQLSHQIFEHNRFYAKILFLVCFYKMDFDSMGSHKYSFDSSYPSSQIHPALSALFLHHHYYFPHNSKRYPCFVDTSTICFVLLFCLLSVNLPLTGHVVNIPGRVSLSVWASKTN